MANCMIVGVGIPNIPKDIDRSTMLNKMAVSKF